MVPLSAGIPHLLGVENAVSIKCMDKVGGSVHGRPKIESCIIFQRCCVVVFSLLLDDPHMHKNTYPYFRDIEITEVRYQVGIDIISTSHLKIASTTIPVKQCFCAKPAQCS